MSRSKFVHPEPDAGSTLSSAQAALARMGLEREVAGAVAELFMAAASSLPDEVDDLEDVLRGVAEAVRAADGLEPRVEVALLLAVRFLGTTAFHHTVWKFDRGALVERLAVHLAGMSSRVPAAFRAVRGVKDFIEEFRRIGAAAALVRAGALDASQFVDVLKVCATTKGRGGHWSQPERERDLELPDFWVAVDPERAMASFATMLRHVPQENLGAFADGLLRSLELRYPGASAPLYPMVRPLAEVLCARRREEKLENDPVVTRCCWEYGQLAVEHSSAAIPEDRVALHALALQELGRMRTWLRSEADDAAARFAEQREYLESAVFFPLRTDEASFWDVLRRLLLALRELPHLSVPLDLRTWDEQGLPPLPRPWSWVPERISTILDLRLGRELKHDPDLVKLRDNLARFCLERLKTREPTGAAVVENAAFVEPIPVWRLAYVHAAGELHANPGGRGHKVLAWSHDHDPDAAVRDDAKVAMQTLRRADGLPANASPRRAIYAAIWWLRQAHVIALGAEPDQDGAQRTFRKEVRRAREIDARAIPY